MQRCFSCEYMCFRSEGYVSGRKLFCSSCHALWIREEKDQQAIGRAKVSHVVATCSQCGNTRPLFNAKRSDGEVLEVNVCRKCWKLEECQAKHATEYEHQQFDKLGPISAEAVTPVPYTFPMAELALQPTHPGDEFPYRQDVTVKRWWMICRQIAQPRSHYFRQPNCFESETVKWKW